MLNVDVVMKSEKNHVIKAVNCLYVQKYMQIVQNRCVYVPLSFFNLCDESFFNSFKMFP